eukprot:3628148-Amphidinium_carterae.2
MDHEPPTTPHHQHAWQEKKVKMQICGYAEAAVCPPLHKLMSTLAPAEGCPWFCTHPPSVRTTMS